MYIPCKLEKIDKPKRGFEEKNLQKVALETPITIEPIFDDAMRRH